MRIVILSRSQHLYSTRRLMEAGRERNHEMIVVNPLKAHMNIASQHPQVYSQGELITGIDAVIPRIGASITFYGCALLRQFEMAGVLALNDSDAITRSRDKLCCLQLLSTQGIDLPITGFAHSPDDIPNLIQMVGGAPLVIKLLEGTQGLGVVLCETKKAAESVLQAFMKLKHHMMVQEYIKESAGADIRCFVIGGKVIAAMKRQGPPGEFRSNLHCGGIAETVKITPIERAIAVKAAKTLGLHVAGVDILRSDRGPLIMEVNSSPGLEGIEMISNKNIASLIIQYLEERYHHKKSKKNPK